eukprot:6476247-Amphidinium_carterae.1
MALSKPVTMAAGLAALSSPVLAFQPTGWSSAESLPLLPKTKARSHAQKRHLSSTLQLQSQQQGWGFSGFRGLIAEVSDGVPPNRALISCPQHKYEQILSVLFMLGQAAHHQPTRPARLACLSFMIFGQS